MIYISACAKTYSAANQMCNHFDNHPDILGEPIIRRKKSKLKDKYADIYMSVILKNKEIKNERKD